MMALGHTAIAAVTVASGLRDPYIAFSVNLLAHPVVDLLPHVDFKDWLPPAKGLSKAEAALIGADVIASVVFVWLAWLTHGQYAAFWWAALGGFLPDALFFPGLGEYLERQRWYQPWLAWHKWCHDLIISQADRRRLRAWGIPAPLIVIGLATWWLWSL